MRAIDLNAAHYYHVTKVRATFVHFTLYRVRAAFVNTKAGEIL